jgi:hypothetical protein
MDLLMLFIEDVDQMDKAKALARRDRISQMKNETPKELSKSFKTFTRMYRRYDTLTDLNAVHLFLRNSDEVRLSLGNVENNLTIKMVLEKADLIAKCKGKDALMEVA